MRKAAHQYHESEDERFYLESFIRESYDPERYTDLRDWSVDLFRMIYIGRDVKFTSVISQIDIVGGWFYDGKLYAMPEWMALYKGLSDVL